MRANGIFVAEVSWPEVMTLLGEGAAAVLPVGAASKEHGPHLPMNTDYLQAQWLAQILAQRARVAVWPTLAYGYYPAFVDYPGSVSLSVETFRALAGEVLEAIRGAGACRCLVLNTGISTIGPLRGVIEAIGSGWVRLVNVYEGPAFRATAKEVETQDRGSHADELETSIMLAIDPDKVDMSKAPACADRPIQGVLNRVDPEAPNYSPSGVYGDATLATPEKGHRLVQAMLSDVLAALQT